eukprot:TRINITY_DN2194_c0_g2_i1.p1 TRINITY_DN2194_c0_g2~~TRINITY_DN2194_c0_g2_i1.p1  ORF type:complete len:287 (+),score=85.46 TRINITY_DN2194_c0_g2_i1:131-862(+)
MSNADFKQQFTELTKTQSIDAQALTFLKAFVAEFQGNFEEVLKLAEEFKGFCSQTGTIQELDEFEAHRFMEKRGETKTVKDMRDQLADIDLDLNHRVAFIEYLLFRYKKSLKDLFTAKPNAALVAKLEKAILQYRAVFEEKKAREVKMDDLRNRANNGDVRAKSELRRMEMDDPAKSCKDEMSALHARMAAQRALKNPKEEEDKLYQEEQARVAEGKQQEEREARKKADDSKARLKARSAMWS